MSATSLAPGVPHEFVGRARVLLRRLEAAEPEYVATMATIMLPLRDRHRRHAKLAAGDTMAAEKAWREKLPAFGRIAIETKSSRVNLHVRELRAFARTENFQGWTGSVEPAVALLLIGIELRRHRLQATKSTVATVGIHALARRFQRGFDTTDETIFAEFRAIAGVSPGITDAGTDFRIPVSDGVWAGGVATVTDDTKNVSRALAIRTFI
jgi:hypothetical protein